MANTSMHNPIKNPTTRAVPVFLFLNVTIIAIIFFSEFGSRFWIITIAHTFILHHNNALHLQHIVRATKKNSAGRQPLRSQPFFFAARQKSYKQEMGKF
jgi:hypothetical protein